MSCSAKAAPPWPSKVFTGPAADGAVCASVTVLTELSTDCAAVMVRPALVRPVTKLRRDTPLERYWITRSRISFSRELQYPCLVAPRRLLAGGSEIRAEILGHQLDLLRAPERAAPDHSVEVRFPGLRILALILPHRLAMALEALAGDQLPARWPLLGARRYSQERCSREGKQGGATDAHGSSRHLLCLTGSYKPRMP